MGFRALRVINDDIIAGGGGFGTHPHRDMEIISYILAGALEHKDSMGNGAVMRTGEVQRISAGTGIAHSEFNHSKTEPVHLLQIWILPDAQGVEPGYAQKSFLEAATGQLTLIASKAGRDGSISINQDADVYLAKFAGAEKVAAPLRAGRGAWVHAAQGVVTLNGHVLQPGDSAAVEDESQIALAADGPAQALIFDLP